MSHVPSLAEQARSAFAHPPFHVGPRFGHPRDNCRDLDGNIQRYVLNFGFAPRAAANATPSLGPPGLYFACVHGENICERWLVPNEHGHWQFIIGNIIALEHQDETEFIQAMLALRTRDGLRLFSSRIFAFTCTTLGLYMLLGSEFNIARSSPLPLYVDCELPEDEDIARAFARAPMLAHANERAATEYLYQTLGFPRRECLGGMGDALYFPLLLLTGQQNTSAYWAHFDRKTRTWKHHREGAMLCFEQECELDFVREMLRLRDEHGRALYAFCLPITCSKWALNELEKSSSVAKC